MATQIRVLHIDDDQTFATTARELLSTMDKEITVDLASNVAEALEKISTGKYDVLVSDYEMPQKTGLDLVKELRRKNNPIPFILFTGKGREDVAIQALNLRVDHYINKQGDPEATYLELATNIHALYEKSKALKLLIQNKGLLIESMPNGVIIIDFKGNIIDVNRKLTEISGYQKEELVGKTVLEVNFTTKESFSQIAQDLSNVFLGNTPSKPTQYSFKRKDGSTIFVTFSAFPANRGDEAVIQCTISDVTEHKKAEDALRESQERYRNMIEVTSDFIWEMDTQGNYTYCSPQSENLWGYKPEELIGKTPFEKMTPEDRQRSLDFFTKATAPPKPFQGLETSALNKNGQVNTIETSGVPIFDKDGNWVGYRGISRDITARKKAQEELNAIYKAIPIPTFTWQAVDDDFILTNCNDAASKITQVHITDYINIKASKLYGSRDDLIFKDIQQCHKEKTYIVKEMLYSFKSIPQSWYLNVKYVYVPPNMVIVHIENITERKKAEEALRESKERFAFALRKSPITMANLDVDLNFTWAYNLQTNINPEDIIGQKFGIGMNFEKQQEIVTLLKEVLSSGKPAQIETKGNGSLGEIFLEFYIEPKKNQQNQVTGLSFIAINRTEQKKMEEELRESEERYRMIAENMQDVITVTDTNGKYTYISPSAEQLFGYKYDEIIGKNAFDLIHPDDMHEVVLPYLPILISGGKLAPIEFRFKIKDGSYLWLEGHVSAVKDINGKLRIIVISRDIQERKKAAEALLESEERYRLLYQTSGIGVGYYTIDGKVISYNEIALQHMGGLKLPDIINKSVFDLFPKENAEIYLNRLTSTYKQNKSLEFIDEIDLPIGRKWFLSVFSPVKNSQGNVIGIQIMSVDITKQKLVEVELKESHKHIEIVNEKLHVVGSLTRHDVSNKLMAARANAYLLKKKLKDNPELLKYIDAIDEAFNQSSRIFVFSHLYEKIGAEKPTIVNVAEQFNLATTLRSHNQVEIVNKTVGLTILADSMLQQLFYTLIDNSLKHGKTVNKIQLSYTQNEKETKLIYEDNGVGISQENKSKIFSEGFTTGGSGLGLKLVKRMIEVYGWTISEEGEVGKGAKFVITIPRK